MTKIILQGLVESKIAMLPSGHLQLEIAHATTPEDVQAGRIQWTRLALTPKQARQLADDLRQKAGESRQTPDAGNA